MDEVQKCIDLGIASLGLLGHYNRQSNIKRKEFQKPDLDQQYHHLCAPSISFTDYLYGDDILKNVKEIQDINRVGRKISGSARGGRGFGHRGQGRGKDGFRGRFRGRGRAHVTVHSQNDQPQVKNYKNLQRN